MVMTQKIRGVISQVTQFCNFQNKIIEASQNRLNAFKIFISTYEPASYFEENKTIFLFEPMQFVADYQEKLFEIKDTYYLALLEEISTKQFMIYGLLDNDAFIFDQQNALIEFDTLSTEVIDIFQSELFKICQKNSYLLKNDLEGH